MQPSNEDAPYRGVNSLSGLRFWDRIVAGLFRGTLRRYFCLVIAEANLRGLIKGDGVVPDIVNVESQMQAGEKNNPGARLRSFLILPLWTVVRILPLKNDHPFAQDTRESFTNKVTPEALFLGFLIWLSAALALGSVILHKTLLAS